MRYFSHMNKHIQLIIVAIIALLIGIRIGMVRSHFPEQVAVQTATSTRMTDHSISTVSVTSSAMDMSMMMDGMMAGLKGKTGDAFDQAFLDEMIVHHQGAVEMAKAVLAQSNREELKTLANGIISAQEKEIKQMQDWNKAWFGR